MRQFLPADSRKGNDEPVSTKHVNISLTGFCSIFSGDRRAFYTVWVDLWIFDDETESHKNLPAPGVFFCRDAGMREGSSL